MSDDPRRAPPHDTHAPPVQRTSTFGLSRLAPPHRLVDMAKEIAKADEVLEAATTSKLEIVVEQLRALRAQAERILEDARRAAELHRARCNFQKRPGFVYHLYAARDGATYFSMLSPDDWNGAPPDAFSGSFRLEADMSWTPVERLASRAADGVAVRALLAATSTRDD